MMAQRWGQVVDARIILAVGIDHEPQTPPIPHRPCVDNVNRNPYFDVYLRRTPMENDIIVLEALIKDLGLCCAAKYARKIGSVSGGHYSSQYSRIADDLELRIKAELDKRIALLKEISMLPGYHPVEGDIGSLPV